MDRYIKVAVLGVLFFTPFQAFAAIAYSTAGIHKDAGTATTTVGWDQHAPTGPNTAMYAGLSWGGVVANISGCTFAGKGMTQMSSSIQGNGFRAAGFFLMNPSVGTSSVICTFDSSVSDVGAGSESYTGVASTTPEAPGTATLNTSATFSQNFTTTTSGDWVVWWAGNFNNTGLAGLNTNNRGNPGNTAADSSLGMIADSGVVSPGQTWTMNANSFGGTNYNWAGVGGAFVPASATVTADFSAFLLIWW